MQDVGPLAQRDEMPPRRLEMGARSVAQILAQPEALSAHAQHERRRRLLARDLPMDAEDRLRSERVGAVAGERRGGRDPAKAERNRSPRPRIDEEHEPATGDVERVLDLQLEILDELEVVPHPPMREERVETIEQQRAERVVAATAIADGDDENGGAMRRRGAAFRRLAIGCLAG